MRHLSAVVRGSWGKLYRTQAWLRGEEIEARTAQNGWCCVTVDGMPLSGGKVSGGKVKNHLPKALRNLG